MFFGFPHKAWTRIGTTPRFGASTTPSAGPMSVFPSPKISSVSFGGDIAEQLLFAEVVPEFTEVEGTAAKAFADIRSVAQWACTDAPVRLPAHQCDFVRFKKT